MRRQGQVKAGWGLRCWALSGRDPEKSDMNCASRGRGRGVKTEVKEPTFLSTSSASGREGLHLKDSPGSSTVITSLTASALLQASFYLILTIATASPHPFSHQ